MEQDLLYTLDGTQTFGINTVQRGMTFTISYLAPVIAQYNLSINILRRVDNDFILLNTTVAPTLITTNLLKL